MGNNNSSRRQRRQDIENNISEILQLLKEHEEILVSPVSPDQKRNTKRRITELKELLAEQEAERAQLDNMKTENNMEKLQPPPIVNGELQKNLAEIKKELSDLKRGQGAIYQLLTETRNQQLGTVIQMLYQGNFKQEKMQEMLAMVQQTLSILQENKNRLSPEIVMAVDSTSSAIQSEAGLQGKLELTLPIIPLLLDYKVELTGTNTINLSTLWQNIEDWWNGLWTNSEKRDVLLGDELYNSLDSQLVTSRKYTTKPIEVFNREYINPNECDHVIEILNHIKSDLYQRSENLHLQYSLEQEVNELIFQITEFRRICQNKNLQAENFQKNIKQGLQKLFRNLDRFYTK